MNSTKINVELKATTSTKIDISLDSLSPRTYTSGSITIIKSRVEFEDYYYFTFGVGEIENTYIRNPYFTLDSNDWYKGTTLSASLTQYVDAALPAPKNEWYYDFTSVLYDYTSGSPLVNYKPWANIYPDSYTATDDATEIPIRMSASSRVSGSYIDQTHQFEISFAATNGEAIIPDNSGWIPPIKDPIVPPIDPPYYTHDIELPDGSTETISTSLKESFMVKPSEPVETVKFSGESFIIEPEYGVQLGWYVAGSGDGYTYKTIISESGATSFDIYSNDVVQETATRKIRYNFVPSELFPGAISGCPVRVYVYAKTISIPQSSVLVKNPYVRADNVLMRVAEPTVVSGSMAEWAMSPFSMVMPTRMYLSTLPTAITSACAIEYLPIVSASIGDVDGKTDNIRSASALDLTFGRESAEVEWVTWIPYSVLTDGTMPAFDYGTHIVSACLVATSVSDKAYVPGQIFSISSGFQNQVNMPQPTSWDDLKALTIKSQKSEPIVESWESGQEYYIDLTDSAKSLMQSNDAIWWWSQTAAIILKDNGSSENNIRTIASGENNIVNGDLGKPRLVLNIARNSYNRTTMGTNIIEGDRTNRDSYKSITNTVSGSASTYGRKRGLLWFNLQGAPTATTSAKLYLRIVKDGTAGVLNIHKLTDYARWDWHSACWGARLGTRGWSDGAGDPGGAYIETAISGSKSFSASSSDYTMEIDIDMTTLNGMINNPNTNNGFILKLSSDNTSNGHLTYYTQNLPTATSLWARPKLVINGTYVIQEQGEPEGGGAVPPPSIGGTIELEQSKFIELAGVSPSYTLTNLSSKINRYIVVAEGYHGGQSGANTSHIQSITVGGVQMQRIAEDIGHDESNIVLWGAHIPDTAASAVFGVTRVGDVNRSDANSWVLIREFSRVNRTTPVRDTYANRDGANSHTSNQPRSTSSVDYVAKGYVADAIYLDNGRNALGTPKMDNSLQAADYKNYKYCYSHYQPPTNSNGTINMNWTWNWERNVPVESQGSESAYAIVSLNPD